MKKLLIVLVLFCLAGGAIYSQSPVNMNKGDLAAAVGANFGWDYGVGASLEYVFARLDVADAVPITFGVALRGGVGFISSTNYLVAGLATAHLSFGFIPDLPGWIKNFDFYYGLGLGVGAGSAFGIGIANSGGVAYYLVPNIALYTSVLYVRYFQNNPGGSGFGSVGLIFKF
jgi:hypothetical protein